MTCLSVFNGTGQSCDVDRPSPPIRISKTSRRSHFEVFCERDAIVRYPDLPETP